MHNTEKTNKTHSEYAMNLRILREDNAIDVR